MATYASLTDAEKTLVQAWNRDFRGWVNSLATLLIQGRVVDDHYDAVAGPIIATLDPGEVIPNTGGLAGAADMDTAETATLVGGINSFRTTYDTTAVRALMAKAAGPTAGL